MPWNLEKGHEFNKISFAYGTFYCWTRLGWGRRAVG
jgi:hypothetical protein